MPVEPSDQELIERIRRQQDQQAMAALYDRYARSVYSVALHVVREQRAAEDIVQDAFLTFWQRPHSYVNDRGAFGPWILRVARNRGIDILRRRGREQFRSDDDQITRFEDRIVDPEPEPGDQVWSSELAIQVRTALADLSGPQRQVIELAYFRGMTQSEMAGFLDIPLGTIKTRVRSALRRLNQIMAESEVWTDVP